MSRNFLARLTDSPFVPRRRNPQGGHLWINVFGRDWVVKRIKPTLLGIVGTFISVLGLVGMLWGSLERFDPQRVGIACLIVGVTLICYKRLEVKNLAADHIFNLGREQGEGDGYDEGFRDGLEEGEKSRQRPVVVPLSPRCTDCGHCSGLQPVGVIADHR